MQRDKNTTVSGTKILSRKQDQHDT